jgi:hypothetical protein
MSSRGRHKVFVIFWTWSIGPFAVITDIISASGGKSLNALQKCKLSLFPRHVPSVTAGRERRSEQSYMDVLRPNDWVLVFVDPLDGDEPEPLFFGFIDDVRLVQQINQGGVRQSAITVSCSGWEKAIQTVACISNAWVSSNINIATLHDIVQRAGGRAIPKTAEIISAIVQTFLEAESTETFLQRQADNNRSREQLEQEAVDRDVATASDVEEDSPTSPSANTGQPPIKALMGQFELPRSRTPLWRLIKMKFEDLKERTFTIPETMVNMLGMPLSRFVDEWSNSLMNELFYDVRRVTADGLGHLERGQREISRDAVGGYTRDSINDVIESARRVSGSIGSLFEDVAPYMVLMRRPLFLSELIELEGPTIDANDLTKLELGFSDTDHYNMSWIEPKVLDVSHFRAASGLTGFDYARERSIEMIRRHGLRLYQDQTNSWPDNSVEGETPSVPNHNPEMFREWNERIQRAGLDQIELLTGSASMPKFVRGLYIGGKIIINVPPSPQTFQFGTERVFYVDGLDWSYNAQSALFTTDISLSRGYEFSAGFRDIGSEVG